MRGKREEDLEEGSRLWKRPRTCGQKSMTETSITTYQLDNSLNFLSYICKINNCGD